MRLYLQRHNASSTLPAQDLQGPVPRVGEYIHLPANLRNDMEGHEVAIVTHVHYRIKDGALCAEVTALASHDTSAERYRVRRECGWLSVTPD